MSKQLDELTLLWSQQEIEQIAVGDIETELELFQPRHYWKFHGKALESKYELKKLGEGLDATLAAGGETVDPIWLIEDEINEAGFSRSRLVVVDGHQRLEAYRRQNRKTIPCRVYRGKAARPRGQAVAIFVNSQSRKADLNDEERVSGAWRLVCYVTRKGRRTLVDAGTSSRQLCRLMGGRPGKSTLNKMEKKAFRLRRKIQECSSMTIANGWPIDYEDAKKMDLPENAMSKTPAPDWEQVEATAKLRNKRWEQLRLGVTKSKLPLEAEIELQEELLAFLEELKEAAVDEASAPF